MTKEKIAVKPFLFPMPIVIVGTKIDNKPNYMTASFVGIMNYDPLYIAISVGPGHLTNQGIKKNKTFTINVPSAELLVKTDYVGMSDKPDKKADVFTTFYGDLKTTPLILEAPICAECELVKKLDLGNKVYIGQVKGLYAEEDVLTDGGIDIDKVDPVMFSLTNNRYYALGDAKGTAWTLGKLYNPET